MAAIEVRRRPRTLNFRKIVARQSIARQETGHHGRNPERLIATFRGIDRGGAVTASVSGGRSREGQTLTDFTTTTCGGRWQRDERGGAVGGARVFREKEKRGSSARVSRRNRWLNRAVKQLAKRRERGRGVGEEREREGCIGEEVKGRVKKVGLREVQSRDRGFSAPRSLSPLALSLRSRNTNCELIVRIISRVALSQLVSCLAREKNTIGTLSASRNLSRWRIFRGLSRAPKLYITVVKFN